MEVVLVLDSDMRDSEGALQMSHDRSHDTMGAFIDLQSILCSYQS